MIVALCIQIYFCFTGEKPIDSLQLMMDASVEHSGNIKISDEEITANAFVFILAG